MVGRPNHGRRAWAGAGLIWLMAAAPPAAAVPAEPSQASSPVPYGDTEVTYDAPRRRLVVAASGLADGQGHLDVQRLRARDTAVRRGQRRLVSYVDERLADAGASPALAARVHDRVAAAVLVQDDRPLADGSVVVRVSLACSVLERAWPSKRGWWSP